jgi:hypothetical protein
MLLICSELIVCLKKYGSCYLYSSNGALYTNPLTVKGYFRSLTWINTAAVLFVLSIDILAQVEQSLISKNCSFGSKAPYELLTKTNYKNAFPCNDLPKLVEPV